MSDIDVFNEINELATDWARGMPNGEAFYFMHIMKECRMKLGRTKVVRCYKCDEEITVVP